MKKVKCWRIEPVSLRDEYSVVTLENDLRFTVHNVDLEKFELIPEIVKKPIGLNLTSTIDGHWSIDEGHKFHSTKAQKVTVYKEVEGEEEKHLLIEYFASEGDNFVKISGSLRLKQGDEMQTYIEFEKDTVTFEECSRGLLPNGFRGSYHAI